MMFDAQQITEYVVGQMAWHLQAIHIRLFWTSTPQAEPPYAVQVYQARESSPLREEIALLCRAANGEIDRAAADEAAVGEIAETAQVLAEITAGPAVLNQYTIAESYWETPIGELIMHVQAWLRQDDLIGYMDAGRLLVAAGLTPHSRERLEDDRNAQKALLARVRRMVEAGTLRGYRDPHAANPTQAGRVSRAEVEAYIQRRRLQEPGAEAV